MHARPLRLARSLCLVALAALGACRHAAPPHPDSADVHVQPRAQPPVEVDASLDDVVAADDAESPATRRLSTLADELAGRMAVVRELSVERPIARGVMSRGAIVERLRRRTRQEYPAGELELEGAMLKGLGLIPDDLDYERTMFDLLEEQVLGFYDPDERRLFIADWVPVEMQAATMAHELVHALQDQHFDIARFTHHTRGRGDAQTAAMAVIEGDATAAMMDFSLAPAGRSVLDLPDVTGAVGQVSGTEQPRLAAAPRALRDSLLFPYLAGLRLCIERMRAGGHGAIDALLAHPPESTEQVLHPDKLASREAPVDVPAVVPAALADDFELAYHDVLGEFGVSLVLDGAVTDARAQSGAQGWGGDRAMLLLPRGSITPRDAGVSLAEGALAHGALVWIVVMDPGAARDDAEAVELAGMLASTLARRHASAAEVRVAGATSARDVGDGRVSLVARSGRALLLAERIPAASAADVVRTVLAGAAPHARR